MRTDPLRPWTQGLLLACLLGLPGCEGASSPDAAARASSTPDSILRCGDPQQRPWCDISLSPERRTELLLAALSLPQKLGLMAGDDLIGAATGVPAVGTSDGIPELGIPPVYFSDGPSGVREGQATAMPSPLALAAAFDPELARRVGAAIASEVRHKGNDVLHAPTVDLLRTPLAGRGFETFGEDPWLTTQLAVPWIEGAQGEGVIGNVKHYLLNNQEGQIGLPPLLALIGGRHLANHIVDERTLREIYLPPFEAAVTQAGVGSVMCAYNFVNGAPACSSRWLLEDLLRGEWGFDGFVLSDYLLAVKDTVLSARNGTDLEMPFGMFYAPVLLQTAVIAGLLPREVVDRRVGNILRTLFRFGFFDRAAYRPDDAQIDRAAHAQLAREVAEQGTVLLRNRDALLPLDAGTLRSIAVIGVPATRYHDVGGSASVQPFEFHSALDAITARAGSAVEVRYHGGDSAAAAAALAAQSDVALVFVADDAKEGEDKPCLALDCLGRQDRLIEAVAAANPRSVVILEVGGPVLTPWRERVGALLVVWYPGQETGPALARVLFGDTDPGGRLPATFPQTQRQTPTGGNIAQYPGIANQVLYSEGVFIGYRWYDREGIEPAHPFGFGLSYTRLEMRDLEVRADPRGGLRVRLTVANRGARAGWALPQLYLALPEPAAGVPQPLRALKGFARLWLEPAASQRVEFAVPPRDLAYWDVAGSGWRIAPGCYGLHAGSSSRDLPLQAALLRDEAGWATRDCPKARNP